MDGRTNGRKLASLCLPAKAGATIGDDYLSQSCPTKIPAYGIYSAIRRGFPSLERIQIIKSVLCNFAEIWVLPFPNNPKDLDPS